MSSQFTNRSVVVLVVTLFGRVVMGECDVVHPSHEPNISGLDGQVRAFATWDPDGEGAEPERLVVGGDFRFGGGPGDRWITVWNGESWLPLGGEQLPQFVTDLAVLDGDLYASTFVYSLGGMPAVAAAQVLRWDGEHWVQVGDTFNYYVFALHVHNGELFAGGSFTKIGSAEARTVARWTGTQWTSTGLVVQNEVYCLADFNGQLFAGGWNWPHSNTPLVLQWDDANTWINITANLRGRSVHSLAEFEGRLFVGGSLDLLSPVDGSAVFVRDGASWASALFPANYGAVNDLVIHNGSLFAVGKLGPSINYGHSLIVLRREEESWSLTLSSLTANPMTHGFEGFDFQGRLFIGGEFDTPDGAQNLAVLEDDAWNSVSSERGLDVPPAAGASFDGSLVIGGTFRAAGGAPIAALARRVGDTWQPLDTDQPAAVTALTSFENALIIAGADVPTGAGKTSNLARWQDGEWSPIGPEFDRAPTAFAVVNGELIAGGPFRSVGAEAVKGVVRWNGAQWTPIGSGLGPTGATINAMVDFNGAIVAAGRFDKRGDGAVTLNNVARFDGADWHALGSGLPETTITSLAAFQGQLFATGVRCLYRWDGAQWLSFDTGQADPLHVASYLGNLIACGKFKTIDDVPVDGIARWNGQGWRHMPFTLGGVNTTPVISRALEHDGQLYIFGDFYNVNGVPSRAWFRWDGRLPGDADADALVNYSDLTAILANWSAPGPDGDSNFDGLVDFQDITETIANWNAACD